MFLVSSNSRQWKHYKNFKFQKPHLGILMHPKRPASLGFSWRHDVDGHNSALLPVLRTAFTTTLRSM